MKKRTFFSGFSLVKVKELAQWLSVTHPEIGLGLARSNVGKLFDDESYKRIFGSFDKNFRSREYQKLICIIWASLFLNNILKKLPEPHKTFGGMAKLMLLRFIYEAIQSDPLFAKLLPELLRSQFLGRRYLPRNILSGVKSIILKAEKLQKLKQRKDPKLDFSNFFKRNDLSESAYTRLCTKTEQRKFAKLLAKHFTIN